MHKKMEHFLDLIMENRLKDIEGDLKADKIYTGLMRELALRRDRLYRALPEESRAIAEAVFETYEKRSASERAAFYKAGFLDAVVLYRIFNYAEGRY